MNLIKNKYYTLLSLFAFFMPFSRVLNINAVILLLIFLVFIFDVCKKQKIDKKSGAFFLILFFLINLFSITYSENISFALKEITKLVPIILLPIGLLCKEDINKKELKYIFQMFFIANIIAFVWCLIYALYIYSENPIPLIKGFSYFTRVLDIHPSYFSIYLILSFYSIYCFQSLTTIKKILLAIVLCILLLYLKSRMALLIYIIIIIIELYRLFKFYFLLPLSVLLTFFLIFQITGIGRNWETGIEERLYIWKSAISIIKENIIFGVGIGDLQYELDKSYYLNTFYMGIDSKFNCHNQLLQTWLGTGLLGLASLITVFIVLFKKYKTTSITIVLSFITCSLCLMFVESELILQHGIYFFAFFSTIFLKMKTE